MPNTAVAEQTEPQEQESFLGMSDEDIEKMDLPPEPVADASDPADPTPAIEPVVDQVTDPAPVVGDDPEQTPVAPGVDGTPPDSEATVVDTAAEDVVPATTSEDGSTTTPKLESTGDQTPAAAPVVVDYEAEYKKLIAPFKANGHDMQISGVDDAIRLMQMGANYRKKMTALKPNLALMKMLEKNELLDEDKLSYLIDLNKKDPGAIRKLVGEEGIEALGLDEQVPEYKPNTYTVDTREVELDQVLDTIKDRPGFNETLNVISNKLDDSSKLQLGERPDLIPVINEHIELGVYKHITDIIEQERMLGRLTDISDLDAYQQVGNYIDSQGGFDHLKPGYKGTQTPAGAATPVSPTTPVKPIDPQLIDRKRAAGSTKGAATAPTPQKFDPLSMDDAEFEKLAAKLNL